jgi:UDP-N-acetylmuramyl tripeptide synthase
LAGSGGKLKNVVVECDEVTAFKRALDDAQPGEVVLIFYEHLEPVLECLRAWAGEKVEQLPCLAAVAE